MYFDLRDDDAVIVEIWGSSLKGKKSDLSIAHFESHLLSFQLLIIVIKIYIHFPLGRILFGRSMLDLITEITAITGRMKPLPQWSQQGAVAGLEGGTEVSSMCLRVRDQSAISRI